MAAVLVSGVLRGFTGFGFGLAAAPLLSAVVPPAAVPAVLLLQVGSSLVGTRTTLRQADWPSTRILAVAAVLTTPIGILLLRWMDVGAVRLAIAGACALGVVALGLGVKRDHPPSLAYTLPFGLAAGVLSGLCAMPGPPILGFYLSSPIPAPTARSSMIAIFLVTGLAALVGALVGGLLTPAVMILSICTAPAMVVGTMVGSWLFDRAPSGIYRPVGLIALSAIAASAALRAFAG
jgi:hypothetical protein